MGCAKGNHRTQERTKEKDKNVSEIKTELLRALVGTVTIGSHNKGQEG